MLDINNSWAKKKYIIKYKVTEGLKTNQPLSKVKVVKKISVVTFSDNNLSVYSN